MDYSYSFTLTTSVAVRLYANNIEVGQPVMLRLGSPSRSSQGGDSQFSFLQLPPVPQAGQNLTLQITSNATNFTALHANSTGWRVSMTPPGGKPTVDLGFMQDASATGLSHQWTLSIPGDNLTLVSNHTSGSSCNCYLHSWTALQLQTGVAPALPAHTGSCADHSAHQ
jgi:hypothetical protein